MNSESAFTHSETRAGFFTGWTTFSMGVACVLCVLYLVFFGFRALVEVEVQLKSPNPSFFKIYWADEGDAFTEKNMRQVRVRPNKEKYSVFLTHLGNVDRLRIDPLEYTGEINLKKIKISQQGYQSLELSGIDDFAQLNPLKDVEQDMASESATNPQDNSFKVVTTGRDSQFEWTVSNQRNAIFPLLHIINLLLIILAVAVLRKPCEQLLKDHRFVPGMLLLVLLLAAAMAATTGLDIHPDEQVHLKAVNYYGDHLLPPAIDSSIVEPTYSGYGVTRLGNYEIYYQLAGYFTWLLNPLHLSDLISARLFGLFLLGCLLVYAIRNKEFRIFALPLFISAQTWYLFSYTNSDGFALFAALIASYQAAWPQSMLNRFLQQKEVSGYWSSYWISLILMGALVGILLLTKTNFYFFLLFLGAYFLWRIGCGDFPDQKLFWTRVVCICAVGLVVYGGRVALDYAANGPNPSTLRAEMAERHAEPLYSPSTPLHKKHIYLYFKDRGFSLQHIINTEKWFGKTFLNAFGSYGFTQYFPSGAYFETVRNTGLFLIALMFISIMLKGPTRMRILFVLMLLTATALVLMLLWRSWTISFQAQGRYLAPILPMLGMLYYHIRPYVNQQAVISLVTAMFLLGVYSFLFIGLHDIPKLDYFS